VRAALALVCLALASEPSIAAAQAVASQPAAPAGPEGKRLFDARCGMCHNASGMGTGLLARRLPPGQAELEKRQNLPAAYVIRAARMGVGNMPAITRGDVSDAELAKIAAYLAREPGK
jgi:mono/diheme cytochrome c family protein